VPFTYPGESKPYSFPVYEPSPLNRVTQQYGPGERWHNYKKAITTEYLTNGSSAHVCAYYYSINIRDSIRIMKRNNYAAGQLYVTKISDEDRKNITYEFKDKLGQVVLTRQIGSSGNHDTYYVYDSYGNLRAVLPPLAADNLTADTDWTPSNSYLQQYAYLYKYDDRNRCISKKLPGCDWIHYIYDKADQLIFTQDGEMRLKGEWMFSIPDVHGRTVLTGTCGNSLNYLNNPLGSTVVKASYSGTNNSYKGYTITGITLTGTIKMLTANYYDNYDFLSLTGYSSLGYTTPESDYGSQYPDSSKGLLTGTYVAEVSGDATNLYTALYYDYRGRLIQSKGTNHVGGTEHEYIGYNFSGQPLKRKHEHTASGRNAITLCYAYTYDHAGRMTETKHKMDSRVELSIAKNTYDELGRLKKLVRHNMDNSWLSDNYIYNVRSWLTNIINPIFEEELNYSYNGDISSILWNNWFYDRKYFYTYDNLSQLKQAKYISDGYDNYSTSYSYDKHGNMKTLTRYGRIAAGSGASSFGLVDDLSITHTGNQLHSVVERAADVPLAQSNDFKKYSTVTPNYTYNKNGAMTKDLNKGLSGITYNCF
ncbi:RHS repeat-associated core domain-containing protein, partial [Bacteroides sp. 214]|nr:RHS repeat-associated core domain-containing protein [Bacteroides sp. 214]